MGLAKYIWGDFDPSDHICVIIIGLSMGFREVAWSAKEEGEEQEELGEKLALAPPHVVVLAAAWLVWLIYGYLTYFTCTYFHTREESVFGFVMGTILFMSAFCCNFFEGGEAYAREKVSDHGYVPLSPSADTE